KQQQQTATGCPEADLETAQSGDLETVANVTTERRAVSGRPVSTCLTRMKAPPGRAAAAARLHDLPRPLPPASAAARYRRASPPKLAFLPPRPTYSLVGTCTVPDSRLIRQTWKIRPPRPPAMQAHRGRGRTVWKLSPPTRLEAQHNRLRTDSLPYVLEKDQSTLCPLFTMVTRLDLGQMSGFSHDSRPYDYSGYGPALASPRQEQLSLIGRYNLSQERLYSDAESSGTVPTVDLATRVNPAGVVLAQPAAVRTEGGFFRTPAADMVLRWPFPIDPLWVEGAGHNDIELFPQYLLRVEKLSL
uniref:DUF3395 domain-containing protein n=1 Tax=Macrostomum lignano TaxID=282301 RepID=A0A1I8F756_9PLAT